MHLLYAHKKGKNYDDIDDMLGDLLADTPSTYKPSAASSKSGAKPGARDDGFYSSLAAAAAENEMSDVSEADPDEIAKSLANIDDMDAALFGPKKSTTPSKPVTKATGGSGTVTKTTGLASDDWLFADSSSPKTSTKLQAANQTTHDALPHTKPSSASNNSDLDLILSGGYSKQQTKPAARSKKFTADFDEEDPLAGLLSDEEDTKPKPRSLRKAAPQKQDSVEDDSSQGSRRLDIERPPTRSGSNDKVDQETTKKPAAPSGGGRRKQEDDFMFDDDDVLGGMGLDSPRRAPPARHGNKGSGEEPRPGGAKSIMDDLLGTESVNKLLERPGTGEKRDFVFDKKSTTSRSQAKDKDEEDFQFGSYMPTAATGSRPSSRRSVRFEEDEDGDKPSSRGSESGKKRGGASSYMEQMVDSDNRDWLDIAGGSSAPASAPASKDKGNEQKRPSSEGSIMDKPKLSATTGSAASEPVDWLGLSRLGSPDVTPRSPDPDKGLAAEVALTGSKPGKPVAKKPVSENDDDDLPFPKTKTKQQTPKPAETTNQPPASSKGGDWLGLGDTDKTSDWLGIKESTDGDYLGLGADIDTYSIFSKPKERHEDLFTAPANTNMSASLPWDSERPRGRRDRGPTNSMVRSSSAEPHNDTRPADTQPHPQALAATLPPPAQTGSGDTIPGVVTAQPPAAMETVPGAAASLPAPVSAPAPKEAVRESLFGTSTLFSDTLKMDEQKEIQKQKLLQQQLIQQQQQQQQLQVELQKQLQHQQDQQMTAMKNQQRELLEQQLSRLSQPTPMPSAQLPPSLPTANLGLGYVGMYGEDLQGRAKRLEAEMAHLQTLLDITRGQHREELKFVEESYKKRLDMQEDTWQKRENRLREENEILASQNLQRLRRMEEEKEQTMRGQIQKYGDWEQTRLEEITRMKQIHQAALDELRSEHCIALERVNKAKHQELEAAISASDHARHLQAVISRVEEHASNLDDLQEKVEGHHVKHITDRETAARAKDVRLAEMQDRLERQQHENEKERARLQGLITKLEVQLTEQVRHTEEEKWRVRQEEGRLKALQTALEQERNLLMEDIEREKDQVSKAKTALLAEQKSVLSSLADERRALADERAQFNVGQRLKADQEIKDSVNIKKDEAELENSIRFINTEKSRLATEARELELEREKHRGEREQLEQQKRLLQVEKQKLEQLALQVNQKSQEIQDMCQIAAQARDQGQAALSASQQQQAELTVKTDTLQKQMASLREKERQIAEERLSLARERQELDNQRGANVCVNCRTPVRDPGSSQGPGYKLSPAARGLYSSLQPEVQGQVQSNILTNITAAIHMDKEVRLWHKSAQKDKNFLTEESLYLQALKTTPYHGPSPSSQPQTTS